MKQQIKAAEERLKNAESAADDVQGGGQNGVAKMQRQAEREGGQFLILSPNDGSAAALSALPLGLSSASEDRNSVSNSQENAQKSGEKMAIMN